MKYSAIFFIFLATTATAVGVPRRFIYQGTLKENGAPVNAKKSMIFKFTSSDGQTVYWVSENISVLVTNGYFSAVLTPKSNETDWPIDWQNVIPYIEVTIDSTVLLPREPITSNFYSLMSQSVVDGAVTAPKLAENSVTRSKLASDAQEYMIPSGAILMFSKQCPSTGWIRFDALDDKFPMGSLPGNAGGIGGTSEHAHIVKDHHHSIPDHSHDVSDQSISIGIGIRNIGYDDTLSIQTGRAIGSYSTLTANQWIGLGTNMSEPAPTGTNPIDVAVYGPRISGKTNVSGAGVTGDSQAATEMSSNVPPYLKVVYCQKQ